MTRKEVIGNCTLYLGDAREISVEADALVCDPPYGIDGGSGSDSATFGKGEYELSRWQDTEEYIQTVCVPIVRHSLARVKRGAVTPGIRCMSFYPRPIDVGCFWTPATVTHGKWGFTNFHPILYYGKDYRAGKGALPTGIQVTERAEKNGHPCPKPLNAWAWLVDKASKPGETVFDPFMGSGTTGVVCAKSDRRFVGIEIEERYFDIACKRIEEAYRQGDLLTRPVELPKPDEQQTLALGA